MNVCLLRAERQMQKHSWLVLNFHLPISENTNTEINASKQKPRRLIPPPLHPSPPSPCLELLDVGAIRAEQALPSPRQLHCFPGCRDNYGQVRGRGDSHASVSWFTAVLSPLGVPACRVTPPWASYCISKTATDIRTTCLYFYNTMWLWDGV